MIDSKNPSNPSFYPSGLIGILFLTIAGLPFFACAGCGGNKDGAKRQYVTIGTSPPGGNFPIVGRALAKVLNDQKGTNNWRAQANGTNGSQENIRLLDDGKLQLALSNAAITYFSLKGEGGWDKAYSMRTVVNMAPLAGVFLTKQDSGIRSISDLKLKRVVIGPPSAGFEFFVRPILKEHGAEGVDEVYATPPDAIAQLKDGNVDAAFFGGPIPPVNIVQACTQLDAYFIPYDPEVRKRLIDKYEFYRAAVLQAKTADGRQIYGGDLKEDFDALQVGSMHVITSASQDEELVYQLTKTIWEHKSEIDHPSAKSINEENAAQAMGVELHPGAARFYREIGILNTEKATEEKKTQDVAPPSKSEQTKTNAKDN